MPPPRLLAGTGRRTLVVAAIGPGAVVFLRRPSRGARAYKTDDGVALEATTEIVGADGRPVVVCARAWCGGRDAPAAAVLTADADACVYVPDGEDALGLRNRRGFAALNAALDRAKRDPLETRLFVADRAFDGGKPKRRGPRSETPVPYCDDLSALARGVAAVLEGRAPLELSRAAAERRPSAKTVAAFDWTIALLLLGAAAAAVAAGGV
jgi:hypothetical protein